MFQVFNNSRNPNNSMKTKTSGTTTIKWTLTTVETPGTRGCQQQKDPATAEMPMATEC